MEQQGKWTAANKNHGYIKDVVYRSDLDHPNSMHNTTSGQNASMQVQFPKTQDPYNSAQAPAFTMNGYYDKEAATIKNGFKAPKSQTLLPVD